MSKQNLTASEKLEIEDNKRTRYILAGNRCEHCGELMFYEQSQYAHRISKSKANLKKYGPEIIHHDLNLKLVCSLKCNSAVLLSPATHPVEAEKLVNEIRLAILDKAEEWR